MEPSCPPLDDLEQGAFSIDYNSTLGLFVAKYICGEGFVMNGDYRRYCLKDGTWTGQEPFCVEGELYIMIVQRTSVATYLKHKFKRISNQEPAHDLDALVCKFSMHMFNY